MYEGIYLNMDTPLVSVIVPVYNAENTLHACVKSISEQTYHNIEIIQVNDGSKDDSLSVCRALAAGDVRALGAALGNVLEPVSRRMRPEIDRAIRAIEESGAVGARMTGSGSAVFGVFMRAGACRRAADRLAAAYPTCRMMRTAAHGVVVEEEA